MQILKDLKQKKILITREFNAPLERVWQCWTTSNLLDEWWAPKPWKAKTTSMDFREGGRWNYAMVGPDGTENYVRVDFISVVSNKSFTAYDVFCDDKGNVNNDLPGMEWKCEFTGTGSGTSVKVELTFATEADLEKIVEMGFEEGFTSALGNLDELFELTT